MQKILAILVLALVQTGIVFSAWAGIEMPFVPSRRFDPVRSRPCQRIYEHLRTMTACPEGMERNCERLHVTLRDERENCRLLATNAEEGFPAAEEEKNMGLFVGMGGICAMGNEICEVKFGQINSSEEGYMVLDTVISDIESFLDMRYFELVPFNNEDLFSSRRLVMDEKIAYELADETGANTPMHIGSFNGSRFGRLYSSREAADPERLPIGDPNLPPPIDSVIPADDNTPLQPDTPAQVDGLVAGTLATTGGGCSLNVNAAETGIGFVHGALAFLGIALTGFRKKIKRRPPQRGS